MSKQKKEDAAKEITDTLQAAAAELHRIYEPQWNARTDVLKTIVSLSSGSVILSVTFASSLRSLRLLESGWKWLTLFSFAMFLTAIILALVALLIGAKVYEIQSGTFDQRMRIQKAFLDATNYDEFMKAFTDIETLVNERIAKADRRADKLFQVSAVSFGLAVISLAVVGIKQFMS